MLLAAAAIVALSACGPQESSEPEAADFAPPEGLIWRLIAEPVDLEMDEREEFRLHLEVENGGNTTVDPMMHSGTFHLDGSPAFGFDRAFSNGGQLASTSALLGALPPGRTVRLTRGTGTLFPRPGRYVVTFRHGTEEARAEVRIRP